MAVLVPGIGHKALGARRWIKLGPMQFQPSEWMKLVIILLVARYFANLGGRSLSWKEIFRVFALVGIPMLLILKQPDMGTSLMYLPVLVVGSVSGRNQLEAVADPGCRRGGSGGRRLVERQAAQAVSESAAYQLHQSLDDPRGSGYQILQAKIAVGAGGIWGQGAEKGSQTQGAFIPIPHADFIFAAFSEEHGFVGAIFVLLLYFLVLMRLIQNAQTAADLAGSLIIMGIVAVLTFQILVNVGMVIGFMPVTGIPLPLMSYGGSSVLFTFLALGVAMNVRMRRFVN